jgi:hypothetical protein
VLEPIANNDEMDEMRNVYGNVVARPARKKRVLRTRRR